MKARPNARGATANAPADAALLPEPNFAEIIEAALRSRRNRGQAEPIQKYEKGANRIGASRLQQISGILQVPVSFFFNGVPDLSAQAEPGKGAPSPAYLSDFLTTSEGMALTKAFTRIKGTRLRRRIVDLVEEIAGSEAGKD